MGTQDLCGLPRNHKLQNCRAEMMFFIYLVPPPPPPENLTEHPWKSGQ